MAKPQNSKTLMKCWTITTRKVHRLLKGRERENPAGDSDGERPKWIAKKNNPF